MKATKFLSLVALVLTFAACSYEDNPLPSQQTADTPQPSQQTDDNMITITAKLAPMDDVAQTRAVREVGSHIVVKWAVDEHLAILYTKDEQKYLADARITDVDVTTGEATIEFSVESGTADSTACTIVYPISAAKDDHSGVKSYADLMSRQDGKLDADLDVRVGEGTILTSTPGLTVTKQPAAQYNIFKFTLLDLNYVAINATEFKFSDDAGNVITTVTPDSATSVLYAALPSDLRTGYNNYWFSAIADGKAYVTRASLSFYEANRYYHATVFLATAGDVMDDHGFFAPVSWTEKKAVAMIAYVGNESNCRHGLAIQLTNDPIYMNFRKANYYEFDRYLGKLGGTWRLPTRKDWQYMFIGCAKDGDDRKPRNKMRVDGFEEKITAAGITWKDHEYYLTSDTYYERSRDLSGVYCVRINLGFVDLEGEYSPALAVFKLIEREKEYRFLACLAF